MLNMEVLFNVLPDYRCNIVIKCPKPICAYLTILVPGPFGRRNTLVALNISADFTFDFLIMLGPSEQNQQIVLTKL